MSAHAGVPRWLWRAAAWGLGAGALLTLGLAAGLWLGWADPPRAGPLRWQDDFKGALERWDLSAGGLLLRDGQGALAARFTAASQEAAALAPDPGPEFTLEVSGAQAAGEPAAAYGLVFDWQDQAHYSTVLVNGNGYATAYRQAGGRKTEWFAWQQWPHILVPPESNRVRVDLRGGRLSVRINDERLVEVEYPPPAGRIGLLARSTGPGAVTFSWARLWAR